MQKNSNFDQRLATIPSEIWSKIAKIDEIKGRWAEGTKLSPVVLDRLKKSVLVTSAGASTRIEGAKLNDEDIERLMQGLKPQKFLDRDSQEVKGYYELLKNIYDSWQKIKFSENTIKHFHKQLLLNVDKDERHRDEYKKLENSVQIFNEHNKPIGIVFETTPAYLTPKEMQELVEWTLNAFLEKKIHPLLIIANFTVEFLKIHPFLDGNGRLSRILTNFLLLKSGYLFIPYISHEKLIEKNKNNYYLSLRQSQKTFKSKHQDITAWIKFFTEIILKQSEQAIKLFKKENIEKILSPKQIVVWQYLNQVSEATPSEICSKTKIARPTVNQVLTRLIKLGRIERIGLGRSARYRKL